MNLNLLKIFIKVAEFGSFTKAAKHLNQPKSRVSRSIARLEEELKVELIKRNTRSIHLTKAGENLYKKTYFQLSQIEETTNNFNKNEEEVSGTLTLSAPTDFVNYLLPEMVEEFSELHPKLSFKIHLGNSFVNLNTMDIDVAFRIGKLKDSSLKQKMMANTSFILVATKDYINLKGLPSSWEDLKDHKIMSYWNEMQNDPLDNYYKKYDIKSFIQINSFPLLKKSAIESKGIVLLPNVYCKKEVDNGKLLRVFPEWKNQVKPLQLVFSNNKNLSKKTRAFIDFVVSKKGILY